jgi:V8-like Glu-specific endopeptidase
MKTLAIAAALALLACGAPADEDDSASGDSAVIGGKAAHIASVVYLEDGCTATKVGDGLLLTAAHCALDAATVDVIHKPGTTIGVRREPGKAVEELPVVATHVHPDWVKACNAAYCGASETVSKLDAPDVAVIEVKGLGDVPAMRVLSSSLAAGDRVQIAGFGCTEGVKIPDARANVTLAAADARIVPPDHALHEGSYIGKEDIEAVAGNVVMTDGPGASRARAGLCPGDSGGPLLARRGSETVVVGVNANYTFRPEAKDDKGLPVTNWHTRLDDRSRHAVAAWLRSVGVP